MTRWRFRGQFPFTRCVQFFAMAMACAGRLAAQSPTLEVLQSFSGPPNGARPEAPVIQGSDGNFYGTTSAGGDNDGGGTGDGTIYEVTPAGGFNILYAFTGPDGSDPTAGLTQGADGNFYGTTFGGGSSGYGTIFQITPAGVLTTLHSFTFNADGAFPNGGLTLGSDGNFYGTTEDGGSQLSGTVFKITPAGAFTTLHALAGADGANPQSSLVQGSDGNFYGTTTGAGTGGNGTIFKITPAGVFSTLHTFTGGADGAFPFAGLAQGSDGDFYGMTTSSGTQRGDGAVFKITPAGVLTILYEFTDGGAGRGSNGALTLGSGGNFYGTTSSGGRHSYGTVFQITPAGVLTTLYAFTGGADGSPPYSSVIQGNDGNLYGTSSQGGVLGLGDVYRLDFPLPAVSTKAASAQIDLPFSFQIIATNSPASFGASNLPPGLFLDAGAGIIAGIPTQTGTFTVALSATNSFGTGAGTLTLTVDPAPVVTLAPTAPQAVAGSGNSGKFTLILSAPAVADLVIKYAIKGSAINGVDYDLIKASKRIKAGKTSKSISIVPEGDLGGASRKVVTLVLKPGYGYVAGTKGKVKVTILSAGH